MSKFDDELAELRQELEISEDNPIEKELKGIYDKLRSKNFGDILKYI